MPSVSDMEVKDQVRQATDIVDLVGSYLPLERAGRMYKALCPWHPDTRPSLTVNPERQSFRCWVCQDGGDVFSFVMKMEGVEFREALKLLAERAGIRLPKKGRHAVAEPTSDKQLWYRALAWAEEQFHRYLWDAAEAAPARDYLRDRGITEASAQKFRLGFSPAAEWDWLLRRARTTEFSPAILEGAGLVISRAQGPGHYDRFRGRLLFSIRDVRGRTIAFGGRVLPSLARDDDPKYINSPETPLFSKSSELYGLDFAKTATAADKSVIVVEGYTDCIMAHQHGVQNVVAVLGTALTEKHIPVLRRYADSAVLVLDGDEAGRRRSSEILEIFVAQQFDLRILTLPSDLDPCDFIATQGSAAFRELVRGAVDAIEHRIRLATEGLAMKTVAAGQTHQANEAIEQILATLANARPTGRTSPAAVGLRQQQIVSRIAREFHVPEQDLRDRLAELRRVKRGSPRKDLAAQQPPSGAPIQLPAWERELVELLLTSADAIEQLADRILPEDVQHTLARNIYEQCLRLHETGKTVELSSLSVCFDDRRIKSLLVQLDEHACAKRRSDIAQRVSDLVREIQRRQHEAEVQSQRARILHGNLSQEQEVEALNDLLAQLRSRQAGSAPTDG
jgi:DNA primase